MKGTDTVSCFVKTFINMSHYASFNNICISRRFLSLPPKRGCRFVFERLRASNEELCECAIFLLSNLLLRWTAAIVGEKTCCVQHSVAVSVIELTAHLNNSSLKDEGG